MNIVYIHTHDLGRYIQPYGHAIDTPNLMELAKEGTLFRHAYCAGPTCSPSRAALLTGMSPHSSGMLGLAHRGFGLNDYSQHLAQFLNRNGYETVLCGVQHEAHNVDMIGYQKILQYKKYDRKNKASVELARAEAAVKYIKEKKDKPFFLAFGMVITHREFPEADSNINPDYILPPLPLYDTNAIREDMAGLITAAQVVDKCTGLIIDALKEANLDKDTIVIFTTDHGIAFPNMKCNLYDTGTGVALIIKYPGNKKAGRAVDALISQIDVFPTLCDLLGLEKPSWLEGKSIVPIFEGETDEINTQIFSEVTFHAAYEPMRCIRTQRYKLIKFYDDHNQIVPANIDDGLSKSFLVDHGYLEVRREKELLFDLYFDSVERVNLINDPSYKQVYEDLSSRLDRWMKDTNDPLLLGKVKKPEGAIVNKLSCLSPKMNDFEE